MTPPSLRCGRLLPAAGPQRRLAIAVLANTVGNGIFLSAGVVVLTRGAGLSVSAVGAGLTVAGLLALGAGVVLGDAADRLGARRVLTATLLLEGLGTAMLVVTGTVGMLVVAATLAAVGKQGSRSAQGALISVIAGERGRVALRAQLRALTNAGISVGALIGGAGLAVDTHAGYVALLLADTATFVIAALLVRRLPVAAPARPAPVVGVRRWRALSDGPYLAAAALSAVQALNYTVLTVGMPLYVSARTDAPRWIISPLLLVNTAGIILLQVRAARGVEDPHAAARALRRAGLAFAVAWTLIGVAAGAGAEVAVAVLVAGVALHTAGELWQAAGQFELSYALAAPDAIGQYQGVFGLGEALANAAAPALATGLCVAAGLAGWAAAGLLLAFAGAAAPATITWAQRRRALAVA